MDIRRVVPPSASAFVRKHVMRRKPSFYHLEAHITDHCNLKCKGCGHFSCISEPRFVDVDEFRKDFERLGQLFSNFERIHLLGGEPLLHPQVADFIEIAREQFPNTRLVLWTNGILLPKMDEHFWKTLATTHCVLLVDNYPIKIRVDEIDRLAAEHGVNLEWEQRQDFYKLPISIEGGHDATESFKACHEVYNCPILKDGRIYPCAYTAYADIFQGKFDLKGLDATEKDSISIYDEEDPYKIIEFLMRPVPWCSRCDSEAREFYGWEPTRGDINEWISKP